MADITYCMNGKCPFKDCERHTTNVPLNVPVSMAWLDGTCKRYLHKSFMEELGDPTKGPATECTKTL